MLGLYSRVSTLDQEPHAQLDALREYAKRRGEDALEFVDRGISGKKDRRPDLDRLMECARRREIDAVAVVKLDRLARSVRHLTQVAEELAELGVDLVVLDQAIDTRTASGKLLFNILGAISEFEHSLIVERTRAGVAAARRRGRHPGRPRALSSSHVARARRLAASGQSIRQIASLMDCSPATVHRAINGR